MAKGSLYVFEGADGVGKSELAQRFADSLTASGIRCQRLGFPGNIPGTLGHHVYRLHHAHAELGVRSMTPAATQMLHVAAHIDAIQSQILPLIRDGVTVVLDRFWWSTFVYGLAAGAPRSMLESIVPVELEAWQDVRPTAAFLVRRRSPLRPEPEHLWATWVELYDQLAAAEAANYPVCVVPNDGAPDEALVAIASFVGTAPPPVEDAHVPTDTSSTDVPSPSGRGLLVFSSIAPARPTKVFDTYWHFAAERQAIFFRRFHRLPPPWTTDTILRHHKFTNSYRASDRVSQFLIRSVVYEGDQSPEELFFRILLFKFFNRIETWRLLLQHLGSISYAAYSFDAYDAVLSRALANGESIYSAAYIMPTGNRIFGTTRKHQANLRLLERMMDDEVPLRLREARSMSAAFRLLRSYPMLGDFLAYQFVTDVNYSALTNFSEMEFVVPGPGARDGIAKCFSSLGGLTEADLIKIVADRQEQEFFDRGIAFQTLWGRRLQLIDCQNLFCEADKYARVKHPDILGRQARTRIKQKFSAVSEPIEYWYPPKWGINERVASASTQGDLNGADV